MEDKRLFLLDAFALIFRAYYALMRNPSMTSKGKNTNAQFGFINTLLQLLKSENPSHIAVCFDTPEATERSEIYADYKANREEAPEDLILAIPDIKKMIQAFNIPIIEQPGYEADDIIGTLSKKASEKGYEVYMVTSDKDYGQLVSDNVFMYVPPKGGGKFEKMGPKEVCEKWDIEKVDQVIDILGLMGDAVDNIPGIKGVGEKTAVKLLKEFGTLENVLENAKNIKGKLGEKVAEGKEAAIMSKKLATIITDVPCVFDEIAFEHEEWNREALKEIFAELEFRTLGKRLLGQEFTVSGEQQDLFGNNVAPVKSRNASSDVVENDIPSSFATIQDTPHDYQLIQEGEVLFKLIRALNKKKEICFDTETTGLDANQCDLVGMSFSTRAGKAYYIPCPADRKECVALLQQFSEMFANENLLWIGQNIKYDLLVLKNYGFQIKGKLFDTMLAHYCFEPEGKRGMDYLSETFLNYTPVSITELIGKDKKNQSSMRDVELEKIKDYAAEDADITFRLKEKFQPLLKENEVEEVFREVEMPDRKSVV